MTDHQLLGVLVAIGIIMTMYGLIIVREVHREVQETLLATKTKLDAAIKILQKLARIA